ncbi:Cytochrome P450 [Mycena venus]|uniref:Cytochrome P450 n=1 Tax=Mycena venus TaxID=2733690 RepID=A0A8H6X8X0_9AGAR|nr:Cytochrome P450 [Mycena venus]
MAYTIVLAAVVSAMVLYHLVLQRRSSVQWIAGPPSPSWIFGHMRQLLLSTKFGDHEFQWLKVYGSVYRLKGCFWQDRLMVADPVALQYILNSPSFYRSPVKDNTAYLLFGENSVITATGNEHRRLRYALNVGFTSTAVRDYQMMFQKAAEMISDDFEKFPTTASDISRILSTASLAAISEAIMGVSHKDLGNDFVENSIKVVKLSGTQSDGHLLVDWIGLYLPRWLWRVVTSLPTATFNAARTERHLAKQIGGQIVRDKKDAARQRLEPGDDLFSRLLNRQSADEAKILPEDDIIDQTALMVVAGQENTANALAFGLMELARHPEFQHKLRAEIHATGAGGGNVGYENMPLLNAFIKETLRLYPGLPLSDRIVGQDTVIPLGESITTLDGRRINQIPVSKGQLVTIAISSYQRFDSHWGKDAHEFHPYRWLDGSISQREAVGPYANLLTFLGGPRTCLGWRFAISELQIIFCEVVGRFSFTEPEDEPARPRFMSSLQPIIATGGKALPLCVTPLS